ncbi:NUDIX domain-containing protein [Paraconexibacter antarcticus]|uniref:NUDIX domain-containing protein n=1 Tax=Paraconexibacter antarcticus TaxID=2949664 RepID=A0ABY5DLI9_9ACTN|nr:NUDIX domain-containing protein [Paraconexibacter antarcticus]UTI62336.1 NUDIX domain-containing protein [Paraconexibacter antarcticus]
MTDDVPVDRAATVLLLRDTPAGPEALLVRRGGGLAFHGGAWVFPGGRVDPADAVPGGDAAPRADLAAARRAAVRETREEAGLTITTDELVTLSHWTTPPGPVRRFATWFFAAAPAGPLDVVVDGVETSGHRWTGAADALAARERGEIELPPPTFVTLWLLREFASAAELLAHLGGREPEVYVPRMRPVAGGVLSLYAGDAAYDGAAHDVPGPRHRLSMLADGWRYERPPP